MSKITKESDLNKQKQLIINFMYENAFNHPIIQPLLDEMKIKPQDLEKKPLEEPYDTKSNNELNELRYLHKEARRNAKIEVIAELLQERGIFTDKYSTNIKHNIYHFHQKNNKSYKSILSSEPDVPLTVPLNQNIISERFITSQKKKLERLSKVSDNIKQIQLENEKKKIDIAKEIDERNEKIRQVQALLEEERNKKIQENENKRQQNLKIKYNVRKKIGNWY